MVTAITTIMCITIFSFILYTVTLSERISNYRTHKLTIGVQYKYSNYDEFKQSIDKYKSNFKVSNTHDFLCKYDLDDNLKFVSFEIEDEKFKFNDIHLIMPSYLEYRKCIKLLKLTCEELRKGTEYKGEV